MFLESLLHVICPRNQFNFSEVFQAIALEKNLRDKAYSLWGKKDLNGDDNKIIVSLASILKIFMIIFSSINLKIDMINLSIHIHKFHATKKKL